MPLYFAGTGPMMLRAAAQAADGLLTASITTPAFVRYVRGELEAAGRDPDSLDLGCTIVASIDEDRDKGRDGAREIAGMYLANKVQNIQGAADTLLECAGLTQDEIRPVAEAMEAGGRLAAKAAVTDEILDKCRPIAGTPEDCIAAIQEYRDAGCTHVMLELWGDDRLGQLELSLRRFSRHADRAAATPASRSTGAASSRRRASWSTSRARPATSTRWPSTWRASSTRWACRCSGRRSRRAVPTCSARGEGPAAARR